MDIQTLSLIISIGAIIGTGVATFFANKKNMSEKVLRQTVSDYLLRIKQLEDNEELKNKTIEDQENRIKSLEAEKRLPLEDLTKLVVTHQTQTITILNTLVELISTQNIPKSRKGGKK